MSEGRSGGRRGGRGRRRPRLLLCFLLVFVPFAPTSELCPFPSLSAPSSVSHIHTTRPHRLRSNSLVGSVPFCLLVSHPVLASTSLLFLLFPPFATAPTRLSSASSAFSITPLPTRFLCSLLLPSVSVSDSSPRLIQHPCLPTYPPCYLSLRPSPSTSPTSCIRYI
ncbi:hypothetical protein FB451DRAFT_1292842 [Mycena latifolia]|nr:hypothetical protein FB451DRAFT_1292842 [Mycena latifolia]